MCKAKWEAVHGQKQITGRKPNMRKGEKLRPISNQGEASFYCSSKESCNTGYLKCWVNGFVYSARLGLTVWNRQSWEPSNSAQLKWLHAPVLGTLVFCLFVCCLLFIGTQSQEQTCEGSGDIRTRGGRSAVICCLLDMAWLLYPQTHRSNGCLHETCSRPINNLSQSREGNMRLQFSLRAIDFNVYLG